MHYSHRSQELLRFNRLTATIKSSLKGVKKAVSGERVMCDKTEITYQSLINGRLPPSWETQSYPSRKSLAPYISDLLHRFVGIQDSFFCFVYWINMYCVLFSCNSNVLYYICKYFFSLSCCCYILDKGIIILTLCKFVRLFYNMNEF